jgi:hypothetical protein
MLAGRTYDSDFTKWLLKYEEQLELLYHDLQGEIEVWEDGEKKWVRKKEGGKQLLNDRGIAFIISALRDTTNKFALMSSIEQEEAYGIAKDTAQAILIGLFLKQEEFDLDSRDYYTIMPKVRNIIHLSLNRAVGGKEREIIHRSEAVIRTYAGEEQARKQDKGWLSGIMRIFK